MQLGPEYSHTEYGKSSNGKKLWLNLAYLTTLLICRNLSVVIFTGFSRERLENLA